MLIFQNHETSKKGYAILTQNFRKKVQDARP